MWKRKAWTLRARMLVLGTTVIVLLHSEVLEPNWVYRYARLDEGAIRGVPPQGMHTQVKAPVDELTGRIM